MVPVPSALVDADSFPEPARLTPDDPLAGLETWLAEGRVDAAAAERARQHWLERQAGEDSTLTGVLMDLGERGGPVAVRTIGGRVLRGPVVALGADFVIVREERRGDAIVPLTAVATLRAAPGERPAVGDRPPALVVLLADALVELAVNRPSVIVAVAGEDLRGDLARAGRDIVAIALDDGHRTEVTVPVDAIDHLVVHRG